jgi:hypothetical protein
MTAKKNTTDRYIVVDTTPKGIEMVRKNPDYKPAKRPPLRERLRHVPRTR